MGTMKLPQFLKKVDGLTSSMEHSELEGFIHEIARILPEERRNDFLDMLEEYTGGTEDEAKKTIPEDGGQEQIRCEIDTVIAEIERINEGEKCLDSEYNEEWDDWYNSDADEIVFSDPEKLLVTVRNAIELIHTCIDMDLIEEGYRLSKALCDLEVSAKGDYDDYDGSPLGLEELYEYDLLFGRPEECLLECLYLTYMGNALGNRAEEMYIIFFNFSYCNIRLENLLQMGEHELPEFDAFLPLWIDYLGKQQGGCAKRLITEAQSMVEDDFALLENARKFVEKHPELYLQLLEMRSDAGEDEKMLDIGLEAVDAISVELVVRSTVALKTAEYADRLCRYDVREKCWLEAFRSDTIVVNYMRIKFLSKDPGRYGAQVLSIITEENEKRKKNREKYRYDPMEGKVNGISENEYCVMMFFERDFDAMEKTGMSTSASLGWSSTFMKEGIALMLLLLYKGNLSDLQAGLRMMMDRARRACSFNCENLYMGTDEKCKMSDAQRFVEIFEDWKDKAELEEGIADKWMKKIEKWIAKRTAGIMDANRRNFYGECAGFIAALGEVKESQGDDGARNRLLLRYKQDYNRRSAFHRELKALGMKD